MHSTNDECLATSKPGTDAPHKRMNWRSFAFTEKRTLRALIIAQSIALLATYMIYFASMVLVERHI